MRNLRHVVAILILGSVDVGWSVVETKCERSPAGPMHVTTNSVKSQTSHPHQPLVFTSLALQEALSSCDTRCKCNYPDALCVIFATCLIGVSSNGDLIIAIITCQKV